MPMSTRQGGYSAKLAANQITLVRCDEWAAPLLPTLAYVGVGTDPENLEGPLSTHGGYSEAGRSF